jgi:predicted SAM-dependent methyltransferase
MKRIVILFKKKFKELKIHYYKFKFIFFKPAYPVNHDSRTYIHLGCGEINSPEYINVDSRPFPHIHHQHDVCELSIFKDEFADLIYTSHTLEHVSMLKLTQVLYEWKRVLKKGGILRIGVPNFDAIINIYKDNNQNIDAIWMPLMGGQEYPNNFHYAVFNKNYLTGLLLKCGFSEVSEWNPVVVENHNFEDWTSVKYEVNGKIYPISLNLEAVK